MGPVLVGRAASEQALRGRLAAAGSSGVPTVLVAGEAGVGKTALVDHVLSTTDGLVLRGRAGELQSAAYDVLAQALRPVAPAAAVLVSPPASRPALAAAICAALLAAAEPAGLVVVLDDLQWADEATLDLLPALADAVRGQPVLLLGCYRSDELPRGHRLRAARAELRRRARLAEITLGPLDAGGVRQM